MLNRIGVKFTSDVTGLTIDGKKYDFIFNGNDICFNTVSIRNSVIIECE